MTLYKLSNRQFVMYAESTYVGTLTAWECRVTINRLSWTVSAQYIRVHGPGARIADTRVSFLTHSLGGIGAFEPYVPNSHTIRI